MEKKKNNRTTCPKSKRDEKERKWPRFFKLRDLAIRPEKKKKKTTAVV